jgi:hypothetical protein
MTVDASKAQVVYALPVPVQKLHVSAGAVHRLEQFNLDFAQIRGRDPDAGINVAQGLIMEQNPRWFDIGKISLAVRTTSRTTIPTCTTGFPCSSAMGSLGIYLLLVGESGTSGLPSAYSHSRQ